MSQQLEGSLRCGHAAGVRFLIGFEEKEPCILRNNCILGGALYKIVQCADPTR